MPPETYAEAAVKYIPERTCVLFVAEAPPDSLDRYFYFEDVKRDDWLWIALMKALFPSEWGSTTEERQRKRYWLQKFQKSNCRLIDAVKTPVDGTDRQKVAFIKAAASDLITEIQAIDPNQIVLIKATVHRALFRMLRKAALPVVNEEPLPFPSFHWQTEFHDKFRRLIDVGHLHIPCQPTV